MGEDARRDTRRRLTIDQAADQLGITVDAVRGRIKRGTIAHEREGGRVYVLLDADESDISRDQADDQYGESNVLTSELRDQLRYVEGQLEAERQAHAEARRLLMAALERIPPQLEAPRDERESPETVEEEPEGADHLADALSRRGG